MLSTSPCLTRRRARAARPANTVFFPQAPIPIRPCSSRWWVKQPCLSPNLSRAF
jgi:hypothetical protein